MPTKITFEKGDITEKWADAIVNPANTDLVLDAGIAGAILRKGGGRIQEECERIGPIPLGEAVVTTAGSLKAFYVIHAAVIAPGGQATADSIRQATHNTLLHTEGKAFKTLAFPALGTGAAGFPMEQCAEIMIKEVLEHLKTRSSLETIYFVLFDDAALAAFEETYKKATVRPPTRVS
jgi:O-acetyl-ADP-ribose deacetylase (regulator of RNase III)